MALHKASLVALPRLDSCFQTRRDGCDGLEPVSDVLRQKKTALTRNTGVRLPVCLPLACKVCRRPLR